MLQPPRKEPDATHMPDATFASPLPFTLGDHDRILKCSTGVEQILEKLTAFDTRLDNMELRIKNVEDWKLRVMAIVGFIGFVVGIIARGSLGAIFGKTG